MNPDAMTLDTVQAASLRWRVARRGVGPPVLLLHGTGSSLASWSGCAAALATQFELLIPDLPGHGGTQGWPDRRASLPRMAAAVAELMAQMRVEPVLLVGHSAGAAVAMQMQLEARVPARAVMSVNGALQPLPGLAAWVFPPLARLMARRSWLPSLVARHAAQPRALGHLIASTGSRLDGPSVAHYRELLGQTRHVEGALDMMAGWQLEGLLRRLPAWRWPLWLVAGLADRTVPPAQARALAQRLPQASVHPLPGLGHLAQEEDPTRVAALIAALWEAVQAPVLSPSAG